MRERLPVLPDDAVLVHVGPFKTGTTAIQTTLAESRQRLREAGISYPGHQPAHHRAARSLLRYGTGWEREPVPPPPPEVWERLAHRVAEAPGRVVVSSEFLGDAGGADRAKLVRDLGPDRVHILAAVRNPAMLALSTWQQVTRTFGSSTSLEEWLEKDFRRSDRTPNVFWGRADPEALISGWVRVLPADRVTVVVLDEHDQSLLPATFEQLLGLPEGVLVGHPPPYANRGLTSLELALIQEVAQRLDSKLSWDEYARTMRNGVIKRLVALREPGPGEMKTQLPRWAVEQAAAETDRGIAWLAGSGVRLAGSLESLCSPGSLGAEPSGVERDDGPIDQVPIELAAEAVVGAIAVATRGTWTLDEPVLRPPPPQQRGSGSGPGARSARRPSATRVPGSPRVAAVPTPELVGILGNRILSALRRRVAGFSRGISRRG